MSMKMLAGAAAIVVLVATPAMAAQQKAAKSQHASLDVSSANRVNKSQARYDGRASYNRAGYDSRYSRAIYDGRASVGQRTVAYAPVAGAGDVVGGAVNTAGAIVGGAIGAAGAIATAPFAPAYRNSYGGSYAYYGAANANASVGLIGDDNGPVCQPGQPVVIGNESMLCQ